jgi:hypothetical protein
MRHQLLSIDPADYRPHPLHSEERIWTQTNCYVDVWIEVLSSLGLEPRAAGAFTLSSDFEGDQWTFFKVPPEDLRALYGLEVAEMNVWRPLVEHIGEQLDLGRLLTVEVDSWFLPDTRGVAYRTEHVKSTIVPQCLDVEARRLGYFHNAGYYELSAEDFDGLFGRLPDSGHHLPPYVELVKLDRMWHDSNRLADVARELTRDHLGRRPMDNPVRRLEKRLQADMGWLQSEGVTLFHQYAFGTCRQCGASAELAAAFLGWLGEETGAALEPVVEEFMVLASEAKAAQFALARAAAGRRSDLDSPLEAMAKAWESAMAALVLRYDE